MPKLIVFRGRTKESTKELHPEFDYTVGRADECSVVINSPVVSRRHARVWWEGDPVDGAWHVEDLGGANGLWVNGEQVKRGVLSLGDCLEFGRHVVVFHDAGTTRVEDLPTFAGARAPGLEEEATAYVSAEEMARMADRAKARLATHLRWKTEGSIRELLLSERRYTVGFTAECEVRLDGNPLVGKKAASIERDYAGNYRVKPLGSLARVRVNGTKITSEQPLGDGDTLSVKGCELTFHTSLLD